MPGKIHFAIAGFGHIGQRHASLILNHPQAALAGVADTDVSYKQDAEKNFHTRFFNSFKELLDSDLEIDVAIIATPNGLHASHAIQALGRNCHVVIEKPMGLTKAECEEVIFKSLQVSRQVFCVMQNRYSPPAQWLKKVITEGFLGKIFLVEVNCFWNRDDRYYKPGEKNNKNWKGLKTLDGGPLFTQFSHFIDMIYWLFGDIINIQTRLANFNHRHSTEFFDDSGLVTFEFTSGAIGCFNYSTSVWDKNFESSITIIGEKGSIKVGGQYMDKVEYCHIENYEMPELLPSNPPNDYGTHKGSAANHQYVIQNVIDTLTGKSTISTNALEGMKVVEIIERFYMKN